MKPSKAQLRARPFRATLLAIAAGGLVAALLAAGAAAQKPSAQKPMAEISAQRQAVPATAAQPPMGSPGEGQDCAPVRAGGTSGFLRPYFPRAAADPAMAALLDRSYREMNQPNQHVAAIATLQRAREAAETSGNTCAQALAVYGLASSAESNDFNQAQALYRQALALFTPLGSTLGMARSHFGLGSTYAVAIDKREATAEFDRAAAEFQSAGNPDEALNARVESAALASHPDYAGLLTEARAGHFPCVEGKIQSYWAAAFNSAGNYDQAMQHDVLADALFAGCPGDTTERVALQTRMGRMEREQGRPLVALQHYRVALRLQSASGDLSLVPQTYNAMAVAYDNMKDFDHSIPLYRKGLAVAKQIHSQPYIDFLEANLGSTYARTGHPAEAIPLLERATAGLTSDYLRCIRLDQLGNAYVLDGFEERGIATLQRSLAACRAQHQTQFALTTLEDLAQAELALHRYGDAVRDARAAFPLVERTRAHLIPQDAYKQGFVDQDEVLYDTAIAALTALHRPGEALEVSEQDRARALLDLLASRAAAPATASSDVAKIRADLIASPIHIASLDQAAMLAAVARLHSTLIAYWSAPKALYVWIARTDAPAYEAEEPVSRARLERLVALSHQPPQLGGEVSPSWRALYRVLIAPIASHLPQSGGDLLTIVPSGPLFALSFSALQAPGGRYLAERFRTHTIPAVGLLAFTQHHAEQAAARPPHFLFVANPAHFPPAPDGRALPPLPGTAVEVNTIARLLPAGEITRLEGRRANTAELAAHLSGTTMLHFATHAVLNEAAPYNSFLALDDTSPATENDGRLSIANIYALHLDARLVVLSACRTGLGKITGDGVDGMSRAFFYAGAASVLTTLGDVADQPTARMMPLFYRALVEGQSPSQALRSAELSTLADLRAGRVRVETLAGPRRLPPDPAYWANFSLSGEP